MATPQEPWVRIQVKTFTRWCNSYLGNRKLEIVDLSKDLADGHLLHNLLECLGAEKIHPMSKPTTMKIKMVENLGTCLKYIREKGIKLVAIGPEDIWAGNLKLILGLIWTLILRFQIACDDDPGGVKAALLAWVNSVNVPQGLPVLTNFKGDWCDGRPFCGLVNALQPGRLDLNTCNEPISNMDRAFADALDLFQIPKILDAIDVVEHPDELSIMTYAAYFRAYMNQNTAYAPNCTAEGPGLYKAVAGEPGTFVVTCRSAENEEATRGGARVVCRLLDAKGNPVTQVTVRDRGTGKYDCEYISPVDGDLELQVLIKTDHIQGSSFRPHIEPGEPSPGHCVASGPGISGAVAGVPTHFTITSKDRNGKTIPKGGANFQASFTDKAGAHPVQIIDNGDGTYTGNYTAKAAGDSQLNVDCHTKANGSGPIQNSPFRFKTKPGKPDFSNFDMNVQLDADGKRHVVAGVTDKFDIHAKDQFGNPCDEGGLQLQGVCSGTENVPVKVQDNGNGSYTVSYTPYKTGPYSLEMRAPDGSKIGGKTNPVPIVVSPAAADGSQSVAYGPGIEKAKIGQDNKFKVQARDAFGNDIKKGGDSVSGGLRGPDGSQTPLVVRDNGDGTYDCSYPSVNKAGPHQLTPTVGGAPVRDAPFNLQVTSGGTDPNKTKTTLKPNVGYEVELRDAHGNKRTKTKKDKVEADATPLTPLKITGKRNEDGTFALQFPGNFTGDYSAKVRVNGVEAPGGPFKGSIQGTPVSDADKAVIAKSQLAPVANLFGRLLANTTPAERQRIIAALGGGDTGKSSSSSSSSSSDSD